MRGRTSRHVAHVRLPRNHPVATTLLGGVERLVGTVHQVTRRLHVLIQGCDSEAGRDRRACAMTVIVNHSRSCRSALFADRRLIARERVIWCNRGALLTGSGPERSGQFIDAVACKVNVLVERQALAVITEFVGAVDEGGLHPYAGYSFEFPRMGSNHHHL